MPCYEPLNGYRSREVNKSGKRGIVFNVRDGYVDMPVKVPCGKCIGCRLSSAREWSIRIMHEASLHESNCFVTLTYDDKHLPKNGSLQLQDFQKFLKRLRKYYPAKTIRYFHCGEYGEKLSRPHYHVIFFGIDFPDDKIRGVFEDIKTNIFLEEVWGNGYCSVDEVNIKTAAYVARYCTKKVGGDEKEDHYMVVDRLSGEILGDRKPEYITMSRRPGIGDAWYKKNRGEVYPSDSVVVEGKEYSPPKYYDRQEEKYDRGLMLRVKAERMNVSEKVLANNSSERLAYRQEVARLNNLAKKRRYENG
ncbi:MAG: replication initiator protein [Arizlama microvirus]|nr:MAG: replication initiator protein [Arizlama microvirus]